MADLLVIEPFSAGSHAAWARGYVATTSHRGALIELPDNSGAGGCARAPQRWRLALPSTLLLMDALMWSWSAT